MDWAGTGRDLIVALDAEEEDLVRVLLLGPGVLTHHRRLLGPGGAADHRGLSFGVTRAPPGVGSRPCALDSRGLPAGAGTGPGRRATRSAGGGRGL